MEYRSVSAKLSIEEITQLKQFCGKKETTPSSLIRKLILNELKFTVPHHVAGRNKIVYNKEKDNFSWNIELDNEQNIEILKNVSISYLEQLQKIINEILESRQNSIKKMRKDSVVVPSCILRGIRK